MVSADAQTGLAENEYPTYENASSTVVTQNNVADFNLDDSEIDTATFENNLKDRYSSSDFDYTEENKVEEPAAPKQNDTPGNFGWIFTVFKALGIVLIIALVAYIFYMIINKEGTWSFGKRSDKNFVTLEAIEKNVEQHNFERLVQQAVANKDFRLAIRYHYLNSLKYLAKKELIRYDPDKTNLQYLQELKNEKQRNDFSYLSYIYNYIWYGEFPITEIDYLKAENAFNSFIK
jgi:hypothetical protein